MRRASDNVLLRYDVSFLLARAEVLEAKDSVARIPKGDLDLRDATIGSNNSLSTDQRATSEHLLGSPRKVRSVPCPNQHREPIAGRVCVAEIKEGWTPGCGCGVVRPNNAGTNSDRLAQVLSRRLPGL
jgi:hypothetical protein